MEIYEKQGMSRKDAMKQVAYLVSLVILGLLLLSVLALE